MLSAERMGSSRKAPLGLQYGFQGFSLMEPRTQEQVSGLTSTFMERGSFGFGCTGGLYVAGLTGQDPPQNLVPEKAEGERDETRLRSLCHQVSPIEPGLALGDGRTGLETGLNGAALEQSSSWQGNVITPEGRGGGAAGAHCDSRIKKHQRV